MNDMLLNMILLPLVAFGHLIAAQDYGLSSSPIVINEVLPKSTNASDWIELYNAGQVDVDLSHWVLSDSDDSHIFSLPVGTVLPSAAYLVIEQYPNGVFGFDFGLAVSGDTVRLFDANDTLVDSTAWQDGDILENESWGRRPNGFGPFVTLCVPTAGTENWDPSKELFDPNRVVEVIIEMVPEDWDFIRTQSRSIETLFGSGCMEQPFGSPFIYKPATVTVDGEMFVNVGVRKKGFLGSLDERKPSLKIKFDKYVDGQELFGYERLTLNNDKSDPSHMRQCLGYGLFATAGIPTPRCNFAAVTVNGTYLGVYSNVESIKKRFLARHFADNDGRLYEGTLSDFREGWTKTFDAKTNRNDPNRGDIDAMVAALKLPDDELLEALLPLIDMDRFMSFWAMEVLVQHIDGYAGNANNYYLYNDPTTGHLEFMPWGIDHIFYDASKGVPANAPKSVLARGKLAHRLYHIPETRDWYLAQLSTLLNTIWDETELLAEIDRIETIIAPYVLDDPFGKGKGKTRRTQDITQLRTFISKRRAVLDAELSRDIPPRWDYPLPEPPCATGK